MPWQTDQVFALSHCKWAVVKYSFDPIDKVVTAVVSAAAVVGRVVALQVEWVESRPRHFGSSNFEEGAREWQRPLQQWKDLVT